MNAPGTNVISSCAEIQSEAGTNILRDRGENTGEEIATHGYKQTSKETKIRITKISQDLQMRSSVTLNCQVWLS